MGLKILDVLNELMRYDDIYACMVIQKGMGGIIPDKDKFEKEVIDTWEVLEDSINETFNVIEIFSKKGLDKMFFELEKYDVLFFILSDSNMALVSIVPALANRGLLEVAMENGRRKIIRIVG